MNIEALLFYILGSLALVSGGLVVSARNPMHSILFLVLVFCFFITGRCDTVRHVSLRKQSGKLLGPLGEFVFHRPVRHGAALSLKKT